MTARSKEGKSALRTAGVYAVKWLLPLALTVLLVTYMFRKVDFREMWHIMSHGVDYWWILAAMALSVLSHLLRAARWRLQLRALGIRPPFMALCCSIFGTYALNLIFPRLGEVWRCTYIADRERKPFTTVVGSMVADRLADTATVLLLTLATFLIAGPQLVSYLSQNSGSYERLAAIATSPWLWGGIAASVAICVWALRHFRHTAFVSKLSEAAKELWQGFAVVASMPGRGRWLVLTVAIWSCYYFQLYLAFFAFPLTADVATTYGMTAVLVCFVLSSISMGVPSNGGIGPWQWAIIFGLSLYAVPGLDKEYATTFANLVMGTQTLLLITLGIITFICVSIDKRRNTPTATK